MTKFRNFFISLFIIFNIMAMLRVHVPFESKFFSSLYGPIDSYLRVFSIDQTWMMFAKNPSRLNTFISAEVEFDDGSKDTYFFPDSSELSLLDKYINGERYRKIISESIRRDDHKFMWKDTAKFALRKLKENNYYKIPLKVDLNRHWNLIPDMQTTFIPHRSKVRSHQKYKFFTYEVL